MRIVAAALAMVLAIAGPALAERVSLTGEVTYRERIALPPSGALSIALIDLASPTPARVSAVGAIGSPGQVPLTFTLNFEDTAILPDHDYALTATIADAEGTVWFTTAEPYPVAPLTPAGPISIVLNRAVQPEPDPAAAVPDAPVVEETLEVPDVAVVTPEPRTPPPILDITWRATSIDGNPVARNVVSSLSIASDMRAGGKGGCNSWFAQAELSESRLLFSAVAATRMACLSDAATTQEDAFFAALAATRSWRLEADRLTLLDGANAALAVLEKSAF